MAKSSKRMIQAKKELQNDTCPLQDALPLVQKLASAKFDETVEIAMRLGVDPSMLIRWYVERSFFLMVWVRVEKYV